MACTIKVILLVYKVNALDNGTLYYYGPLHIRLLLLLGVQHGLDPSLHVKIVRARNGLKVSSSNLDFECRVQFEIGSNLSLFVL